MNICQVCSSVKDVRSFKDKRVCGRHRQQLSKYGKIQERTLADGNTYIDRNTHWEVILYGKDCKERARTLIDRDDKDKVQAVGSWCLSAGYAMNGKVKHTMHILIMGRKKGFVIDHIDGDKLNNRKYNLRFVKQRVNVQSWVSVYKKKIIRDFRNHLAEGKDADSFFDNLLK